MKGRHGYLPYNRGLKYALVAKLQYDNDIYDQGEEFWLNLGFQKDNFLKSMQKMLVLFEKKGCSNEK